MSHGVEHIFMAGMPLSRVAYMIRSPPILRGSPLCRDMGFERLHRVAFFYHFFLSGHQSFVSLLILAFSRSTWDRMFVVLGCGTTGASWLQHFRLTLYAGTTNNTHRTYA